MRPSFLLSGAPVSYHFCARIGCGELGDNAINEEEFYRVMKKRGENPLDYLSSDED